MTSRTQSNSSGFTRIELAAVVTALILLLTVIAPMLAAGRHATEQATCTGNLRQLGQAWQSWLTVNGELPWQLPASAGGINTTVQVQNSYRSFQYLTNELPTPANLVCPADTETVMRATNWALLDTSYYRGNALSYTVGTDSFASLPLSLLSSDRNFVGFERQICAVGTWTLTLQSGNAAIGWNTNTIHGDSGNVLRVDGSVNACSSAQLREYLAIPETDPNNGRHHTLPPR